MGILERNSDGTYRYVRGRVPWADTALDAIKAEDKRRLEVEEHLRRQHKEDSEMTTLRRGCEGE